MAIPAHGTMFPNVLNLVTEDHQTYLRELINISYGYAMTIEVGCAIDLINKTLTDMKYPDDDIDKLNDLQYLFNYKENKGKTFT